MENFNWYVLTIFRNKSRLEHSSPRKYGSVHEYFHSEILVQLKEEIYAKKKKNVSIHKITSAIIRDLGGARVINCKSGKDRTGMAVTLEQTRFLSTYG